MTFKEYYYNEPLQKKNKILSPKDKCRKFKKND